MAVAGGIVRGVYGDPAWRQARRKRGKDRGRWMFTGHVAEKRAAWIGRSVAEYLPDGNQNPIRYVGC